MLITQETYTSMYVDVRLPLSDDFVTYHFALLQEFGKDEMTRMYEDAVRDAIIRKYIELISK